MFRERYFDYCRYCRCVGFSAKNLPSRKCVIPLGNLRRALIGHAPDAIALTSRVQIETPSLISSIGDLRALYLDSQTSPRDNLPLLAWIYRCFPESAVTGAHTTLSLSSEFSAAELSALESSERGDLQPAACCFLANVTVFSEEEKFPENKEYAPFIPGCRPESALDVINSATKKRIPT